MIEGQLTQLDIQTELAARGQSRRPPGSLHGLRKPRDVAHCGEVPMGVLFWLLGLVNEQLAQFWPR
jgi:hypothetical protein